MRRVALRRTFSSSLRSASGVDSLTQVRASKQSFIRGVAGILFFFSSVFLFQPSSEGSDIASRIERATVLRRYPLPGASSIRQIRAFDGGIAAILSVPDSSIAIMYDDSGLVRFQIGVPRRQNDEFVYLFPSRNGHAVVLGQPMDPEGTWYRAFSSSGQPFFEVMSTGFLEPSPSGKHFCIRSSGLYDGPLKVLDSAGKRVIPDIKPRKLWTCSFFTDDLIFLAETDSSRLIDLRTGATLWVVASGLSRNADLPLVRLAPHDSSFVLFDPSTISVISADGVLRWSKLFEDKYIVDVAVDPNDSMMVVRMSDPKWRAGQFVIMAVPRPEVLSVSGESEAIVEGTLRNFPVLWLRDGHVTMWGPLDRDLWLFDPTVSYRTFFSEPHASSRTAAVSVVGLFLPVGDSRIRYDYLRIDLLGKLSRVTTTE